jgi:hypothetical protein
MQTVTTAALDFDAVLDHLWRQIVWDQNGVPGILEQAITQWSVKASCKLVLLCGDLLE